MEVTTIDIKNVCRTCLLPSSDLEVIFTVYFENDSITKILSDVGKIEIKIDDNLSNYICQNCKQTAINAYRFQQMCLESDRSLRILVGNCDQDVIENETKPIEEDTVAGNILVEKLIEDDDDLLEDMHDDIIYEEETDDTDGEEEDLDGDEESSEDNESSELIFSCTECSKLFNSNEKLKKHVAKQHEAQKQADEEEDDSEDTDDEKGSKNKWACKECDKVYKRKNILDRHRRFTHGYVKRPHRCLKCDKAFPYSSALTRHEILHSDIVERSKLKRDDHIFVCVICAREFNLPELLTSHLKSHKTKGGDDEQQFTCKLCHDDFSSYSEILRHSKNHIENATHQCSICNKLLSIGDELIDHFLRHKGEFLL